MTSNYHDYDEDKFAELLLLIANLLRDDPAAGAVKLNKVLYFAEFGHMRATGRPITGAVFQKLRWGPAPRRLLPVRSRLIQDGAAHMVQSHYLGYKQDRLIPDRPAKDMFSEDELESVNQALSALSQYNASESSDLSHEEIGWQMVDEGDDIPFTAAYLKQPVPTAAIREHGAALARRLGLV